MGKPALRPVPLEVASSFGIKPDDETKLHDFDADDPNWNESVYFDWIGKEGELAGHCRIGRMPGQNRLWFWLFIKDGDTWLAIEEPRLSLSDVTGDWSYSKAGLSFSFDPVNPLLEHRLRASGTARVISGPRCGRLLPVNVDVQVVAAGPAHSHGAFEVEGHFSKKYSTSRFEQPVAGEAEVTIDHAQTKIYTVYGQRDHSWGPRKWLMTWTFLVFNSPHLRFQCVSVYHGEMQEPIQIGYIHREQMVNVFDVDLTLNLDPDYDNVLKPASGKVHLKAIDGSELSGSFESVSGHEIDLNHGVPQDASYRRVILRFTPDSSTPDNSDEPPIYGWLEYCRYPHAKSPLGIHDHA